MINFEKLQERDIDSILKIEERSFSIQWSKNMFIEELKNPLAHYIVMKNHKKLMGYGGMWFIYDEAHITNIAVDPDYRGKGNGDRLLKYMINYGLDLDICKFTLEVRRGNFQAINLYKKHGFRESGLRRGYYSDNKEDALIMWRQSC